MTMSQTSSATKKAAELNRLEAKRNRDLIYKYIKANQNQTIYSLTKSLDVPQSTVRKLVQELVEFNKIKLNQKVEKGRVKNYIQVLENPIFKEIYDYFLWENFSNPKIATRELSLAKAALEQGVEIEVEMLNGLVKKVKSIDVLERFLSQKQESQRKRVPHKPRAVSGTRLMTIDRSIVRRKVKQVIDGDTFELFNPLQGSRRVRIANLQSIDRKSKIATRKVRNLIQSKKVTIKPISKDQYGRIVADVVVNKKNIKDQL